MDSKIKHDVAKLVLDRRLLSTYKTALSFENIVDRTIALMEWVERVGGLNGQQKKALVLDVLMTAANNIPDTVGGPGTIEVFLKMGMPKLIDWVIIANGDGIEVNKQVCVCTGKTLNCMSSCFR
jgi:hypothetical protein